MIVVVPARDEERRVGACLRALAGQVDAVVLVLDRCTDATDAVAARTAAATGLELLPVPGPGCGVGYARSLGAVVAATLARERGIDVLGCTDADTVVATDWAARCRAHLRAGADAVGGRIDLEPREAAALAPGALARRELRAGTRLARVRATTPEAANHQCSGASLAWTLRAHDLVGGIPAVPELEDEAFERALLAAGLRIAYADDVRVVTSARTRSFVARGLAADLGVETGSRLPPAVDRL